MTMRRKGLELLILMAVFLIGASAVAAAGPPAEPAAQSGAGGTSADDDAFTLEDEMLFTEIPTVISASRHEQGINEAPASITVVTAEEIRLFGYRSLTDVLANTRGFYVADDRNYESSGVRGFGRPGDYNNRILIMVDGHTDNDKWVGASFVGNDFGIDFDMIDRIEIVRGPVSALYGSNAVLAAINVITKNAADIEGLNFKVGGGSFSSGEAGLFGSKTFEDRKEFVFGVSGAGSSGQNLFFEEYNDPGMNLGVAEGADGELLGRAFGRYRFGSFTLEGKWNLRKKEVPTASFDTVFNDSGTYTADGRNWLELRYEALHAGGAESFARFYFDQTVYHGDYIYDSPPVTVNYDEGGGEWVGAEYRWSNRVGDRQRLSFGGQYEYNLNIFQKNYDEDPYYLYLDQEFDYFNYSLYAQDEVTLGPKLLLNLGFRYDKYQTFGQSTNPRAALIFSPRRTTTIKALYGSAFRAPSTYELYYHDGYDTQKANPSLGPEEIDTYELIWEQGLGRRFSFVGNVYHTHMKGLISQILDPDDGLLYFDNLDEACAHGAEVEVSGRTKGGVLFRGSYTLQRTEDGATSLRLTNSPKHMALGSVAVPIAGRRASIAFQARYIGPRITLTREATHSAYVGDLTFTSGSLLPQIDLTVGVRNLFDFDYGVPGSGEHLQDQIVQNGRTFFVTARHRF